ncbi:hypothetical protein NQZ68_002058 [Dissostichus eleginoides]|nr:hypothetical protein NQZ68_002058 [Dissostichus eleginoides]
MPSELETAMESLIKVFHRYASKDGRSGTLSRRELRELMENELSNFLLSQKDPAAIDKIMKDLDTNGDGQVDFEEFVSLVVGLSIACEQCYQTHMKKQGKKVWPTVEVRVGRSQLTGKNLNSLSRSRIVERKAKKSKESFRDMTVSHSFHHKIARKGGPTPDNKIGPQSSKTDSHSPIFLNLCKSTLCKPRLLSYFFSLPHPREGAASPIIMSDVQNAMTLLIGSFSKYAGKEGDNNTLSKAELKELLQNELGDLLGKANDKAAVDRLFEGLDTNKDNSVDFKEFINMVTCLTLACRKYACKKRDNHTLSKAELKELLQNELGDLLGKANDKAAVDSIFKELELDTNQDNSVDFSEFTNMLSCLIVMCHKIFNNN